MDFMRLLMVSHALASDRNVPDIGNGNIGNRGLFRQSEPIRDCSSNLVAGSVTRQVASSALQFLVIAICRKTDFVLCSSSVVLRVLYSSSFLIRETM